MEQRFHILSNVVFRHTYFPDNTYTGFRIQPDANTLHHFKRLSLLFRPRIDGFSIIYETNAGLQRTREDILAEGLTFGFTITNHDPDLLSYTEGLPENMMDAVVYIRNNIQSGNLLHTQPFISVGDILQNRPPSENNLHDREFFVKPFAWLELSLHAGLAETFYANFKGKETVWRYIINSDHLQDLSQPAVIHKDTKEIFKGPVMIRLPDGKERMSFESNGRIPLCSKPEKVYQLVENYNPASGKYKIVVSVLPNPNVKSISFIPQNNADKQNSFSEIFI